MKYLALKRALLTNKHIIVSTIIPTIYLILSFVRLFSNVSDKYFALKELIFLYHWIIFITLAITAILITVIRFDQSINNDESEYHSYPYNCTYLSLLGLYMSTRGLHAPQNILSLIIGTVGLSFFILANLYFNIAEVVTSYNENVNVSQIEKCYMKVDDLNKKDSMSTSNTEVNTNNTTNFTHSSSENLLNHNLTKYNTFSVI